MLANGFFVAAEYALVTARRSRLQELADGGMRRAKIAIRIMDSPVRFIGTVQLGITAFSILLGVVGEPIVANWIDGPLSRRRRVRRRLCIRHVPPRDAGRARAEGDRARPQEEETALWVALPIEGVYIVSYPVVWFFQASANAMTKLVGIEPAPAGIIAHSEEEIRMIVAHAEETGEIEEDEREMLYKVFDFADKEVSDVMVPRPEVVALSIDLPPEECLAAAMEAPFTRYPVYRDSLDTVIGILHVRDLMRAVNANGRLRGRRRGVAAAPGAHRPGDEGPGGAAPRLPAVQGAHGRRRRRVRRRRRASSRSKTCWRRSWARSRTSSTCPTSRWRSCADGRIRISGTFSVDDFNEQFHRQLPVDDYHTMAGFVFGLIGRAPEPGDEVSHDGTHFKVVEVEGTRIERIEVEFTPVESESGETGEPNEG